MGTPQTCFMQRWEGNAWVRETQAYQGIQFHKTVTGLGWTLRSETGSVACSRGIRDDWGGRTKCLVVVGELFLSFLCTEAAEHTAPVNTLAKSAFSGS